MEIEYDKEEFGHAEYLDYKSTLDKGFSDSCKQYDGALLTLSSGALVLSIAFLKDIVQHANAAAMCLLKASWISFVLVIVLTVVSFLLSQLAFRQQQDRVDKAYEKQDRELLLGPQPLSDTIGYLGVISGFLFILAVSLTLAFAVYSV